MARKVPTLGCRSCCVKLDRRDDDDRSEDAAVVAGDDVDVPKIAVSTFKSSIDSFSREGRCAVKFEFPAALLPLLLLLPLP